MCEKSSIINIDNSLIWSGMLLSTVMYSHGMNNYCQLSLYHRFQGCQQYASIRSKVHVLMFVNTNLYQGHNLLIESEARVQNAHLENYVPVSYFVEL